MDVQAAHLQHEFGSGVTQVETQQKLPILPAFLRITDAGRCGLPGKEGHPGFFIFPPTCSS